MTKYINIFSSMQLSFAKVPQVVYLGDGLR